MSNQREDGTGGGSGARDRRPSTDQAAGGVATSSGTPGATMDLWGLRYQVTDVNRAVAFYTSQLGFALDLQAGSAFARVSCGGIALFLSGPGSSGARPLPDGRRQEPGGWNRLVLRVRDLPAHVATLRDAGVRFRNDIEVGPAGRQIQIEDPDGNPIELFEPAS